MSEQFAIAVEWPDESRPYLVHLKKPYFVAAVRRHADAILFITTLSTEQSLVCAATLTDLLPAANRFFQQALGVAPSSSHFLKGKHGAQFPRFIMAQTAGGNTFIVEPEHPSPLVAVTEPGTATSLEKAPSRFDVVTQWRLAEMRKYYQQFRDRQQHRELQDLVVPAF